MANLYCENCGQQITERAEFCPNCGAALTPEGMGARAEIEQPQSDTACIDDCNGTGRSSGGRRTLMVLLTSVIVTAAAIAGYLWLDGNRQLEAIAAEQARQDSIAAVEQARRDSIAAATAAAIAAEKARQDSIKALHQAITKAYLAKVYSTDNELYDDLNGYYLFDITNDGIPELWISTGTCFGDHTLLCFMYQNGHLSKIYESGGHSDFCRGSNYVILAGAHMGAEWAIKLTYKNGRIVEKTIIDRCCPPDEEYLVGQLKEPHFKWIPKCNLAAIENMFEPMN